jgi:imidazoleglycerol-phosphate dehydratase
MGVASHFEPSHGARRRPVAGGAALGYNRRLGISAKGRTMKSTRKAARPGPRAVVAGRRAGRPRAAEVARATKETNVRVALALDGRGRYDVQAGVPFLNHMLELFTRHGFFDLTVRATGDVEVDDHHTVEDVGLALGQALREALGGKEGIRRFGEATVPLDEALVQVVVDLSGRPFLAYDLTTRQTRVGSFDVELVHDFLLALASQAGMNLHVRMLAGRNPHHIIEAAFKALARALDLATQRDPRVAGVLSTKGTL